MHVRFLNLLFAMSAFYSTACMSAEAQLAQSQWMAEDIAVFRDRFLAVDKSFTRESRAAAEVRLEGLKRRSTSVTPAQFVVELCRIAVLADNGHTRCMSKASAAELCRQWALIADQTPPDCEAKESAMQIPDFATVGIGFRPFVSEFYVVSVTEQDSDLLGARLLSVAGRSIASVRTLLRSFSAGSIGFRDLRAAGVLAAPERLHAVGIGEKPRAVTYEFLTAAGRRVERTFELGATTGSFVQRPPNAPITPWSMQDAHLPFRFRDAPELDAVIIQLRQNVDAPSEKIDEFLEGSESRRDELSRKNVVLDMRFNGGGNLIATRDFMVSWPSRVPGRFYVLTSPQTFSAAIVAIAYLKQAAGDRMTIVGEPVGDRLTYFSDGVPVRLPHSGLTIYMAQVRIDLRDGCRHYDDCHASVSQPNRRTAPLPSGTASIKRMPISIASLEPDFAAPWTIESWTNGTDPMLEAVATLLAKVQ